MTYAPKGRQSPEKDGALLSPEIRVEDCEVVEVLKAGEMFSQCLMDLRRAVVMSFGKDRYGWA